MMAPEFDSWGPSGLGRHRTVDGRGHMVRGPQPWSHCLGTLAFNTLLVLALSGCGVMALAMLFGLVGCW